MLKVLMSGVDARAWWLADGSWWRSDGKFEPAKLSM